MQDRNRKVLFDGVAELYHQVRPEYPAELVEEVCRRIPKDAHILEMGCGTGKATQPYAERGYRMTCLELGDNLAAVARRELAQFPNVEVVRAPFENHEPPEPVDLIISAQAWHWLYPETSYAEAVRRLKPGGKLAVYWNMYPRKRDDFVLRKQQIYDRHAPEFSNPYYRRDIDERVSERTAEMEGSGVFDTVEVFRYDWDFVLTADRYIDLMETYSNHIVLDREVRDGLYADIRALIQEYGGEVTREYTCALYLATAPSGAAGR